jgi:hypothetical protein
MADENRRIRKAADDVATAKSFAAGVLESWSDLPDVWASSGELERAVALLGSVATDLDADADRAEEEGR